MHIMEVSPPLFFYKPQQGVKPSKDKISELRKQRRAPKSADLPRSSRTMQVTKAGADQVTEAGMGILTEVRTSLPAKRRLGGPPTETLQIPLWTKESSLGVVLLEVIREHYNINLYQLLYLSYLYLKPELTRFTLGDYLRNPKRCIRERSFRKDIRINIIRLRWRLRKKLLVKTWNFASEHI
uniref:Uncharacterized protein TCIL3000_1_80 n=1 Tax=Trypanosoma congolense (strain IL3000) TaxID=1068625 RepID=G0UIQ0_TRYCI|nr:unnamed protein product [Trypanosoma congolense IL3000]